MRRSAILLLILVCRAAASGLGEAEPSPAAPFDLLHVRLEIDLDPGKRTLAGLATLTVSPRQPLRSVTLDAVGLDVSRVIANGRRVRYASVAEHLRISLPAEAPAGSIVELAIHYRARPKRGMLFILPSREHPDRALQVFTQGFPRDNRHWFPTWDWPNEKTTSEVIVAAPCGWEVVSNGEPGEVERSGGRCRYPWRLDQPHATYLISFAAGEFTRRDLPAAVPLAFYAPRSLAGLLDETFRRTADALEYFSSKLGPYPWPRHAQIALDGASYAGMENTGAVTLHRNILLDPGMEEYARPDTDVLIAHELAHQWFGNLVTVEDFRHIWLSEGFATYLSELWTARHHPGWDEWRRSRAARDLTDVVHHPVVRATGVTDDPVHLLVYEKGAWIARMLHHELGDEAFWTLLRRFLERHRHGHVTTADLEMAAGSEVAWIFEQFAYRPGHPRLDAAWVVRDSAIHFRVRQQGDPFRVPLTVEWRDRAGTHRRRLLLDAHENMFAFPAPGRVAEVRIDPAQALLKNLSIERPSSEWIAQLADPRIGPRLEAAAALGNRQADDAAVEALARVARADASWMVRLAATDALAACAGMAARTALAPLLDDPHPRVREAAASHVPDSAGIARLAAHDPSPFVRAAAIEALARLGAPAGTLAPFLAAGSPREMVRSAALRALAHIGDGESQTLLERFAAEGLPVHLRREARELLRVRAAGSH